MNKELVVMCLNWLFGFTFSMIFMQDSYWRFIAYVPWAISLMFALLSGDEQ